MWKRQPQLKSILESIDRTNQKHCFRTLQPWLQNVKTGQRTGFACYAIYENGETVMSAQQFKRRANPHGETILSIRLAALRARAQGGTVLNLQRRDMLRRVYVVVPVTN